MRRRHLLAFGPALLASASFAREPAAILSNYERDSGGRVGLYAENLATGRTITWRADERFVMCSTFKASLAACVLARVDRGQDHLDQTIAYGLADVQDWYAPVAKDNLVKGRLSVEDMCRAAVEQSDNTCANLLLARIGGPPALTGFWRSLGDGVSRLDDPEPVLNRTPLGDARDTTTPAAMARTLRRVTLGPTLSPASRATLTRWLIGCRTGANRLRAGLPHDWVIGDKTGNNGHDAAGDIAMAWPKPDTPVVICAYTRGGTPSPEQLDQLFRGIGRLVAEQNRSQMAERDARGHARPCR